MNKQTETYTKIYKWKIMSSKAQKKVTSYLFWGL